MNRCALLFSGGLDSTSAAIALSSTYDVHLWHVKWMTGRGYGEDQHAAAKRVAQHLALPLSLVGTFHAQHSMRWQPLLMAAGFESARRQRMQAVAFGITGPTADSGSEHDRAWRGLARDIADGVGFKGEIEFPVWAQSREHQWAHLPAALHPLVWACHSRGAGSPPCGKCRKCRVDNLHRRASGT